MTMAEFQDLLDAFGAYPAAWPADKRDAATRLLAGESLARAALERAGRLDAAIVQSLKAENADTPADPEAARQANGGRVLAALTARPLPRQRRGLWAWPAPLLTFDFAPAWPRIAVLACVAALGFAIGLVGLDPSDRATSAVAAASQEDAGLSVAAIDSEPLTGVRP